MQTLKQRLIEQIKLSPQQVFLRKDFEQFGTYRQLSRVLGELQDDEVVVRAGYGVYMRPEMTAVETVVSKVRERLGRRVKRHITISGITIVLGESGRERPNKQTELDDRKLRTAKRVLELCTLNQIRRKSLSNIKRWVDKGTWVSALDEWRLLMENGSDEELVAVMTGTDQRSNRLRQSPPYVGLLDPEQMERVH
jgi:hypothetical protein